MTVAARNGHFVKTVVMKNAESEDFPSYALAAPELMKPRTQSDVAGGAMSSSASSGALLQGNKTKKGGPLSVRLEGETVEEFEVDLTAHPLLRPMTPIKANANARKRNAEDQRSMERRHWHIRDKYPYNTARIGTDSNPNAFTHQVLATAQNRKDLGRKMQRPEVAWH